jgi:hypothetical protein
MATWLDLKIVIKCFNHEKHVLTLWLFFKSIIIITMAVFQFKIISFEKNVNNIKEWERIFLILNDKCSTPKHM